MSPLSVSPESFAPPPEMEAPEPAPEQPAAETEAQVTPESFQQFAENSEMQLARDQQEIFNDADKKIGNAESSSGLDAEKVSNVYHGGGFFDRISAIKDKIVNFVRGTKEQIRSVRGGPDIQSEELPQEAGGVDRGEEIPQSPEETQQPDWKKIIDKGGQSLRRMREGYAEQAHDSESERTSQEKSAEDLAVLGAEGVAAEEVVSEKPEPEAPESEEEQNIKTAEKSAAEDEEEKKETPIKKIVKKAQKETAAKKIERRLSPELLKKIEKFPYISEQDKAVFILTAEGMKPGSFITPSPEFAGQHNQSPEELQRVFRETEALAAEAGLLYETKDVNMTTPNGERKRLSTSVIISGDSKVLRELSGQFDKEVGAWDHKRVGELLGFPESAAAGYDPNATGQTEINLPDEVKYDEAMDFSPFTMTREHWREEFPTIKNWAEHIKETAPDLYHKITSVRDQVKKLKANYPDDYRRLLASSEDMGFIRHRDPELYREMTGGK